MSRAEVRVRDQASHGNTTVLCPCECLRAYEARTATFRPINPGQPSKVFLATVRLHKPVRSANVAQIWELIQASLKPILLGGSASSSAARARLSVNAIIKMANWSSDTSFRQFYHKPIHDSSFSRIALSLN